ncbi:MAG: hypothetical protein HC802_04795 [Caldilineaceae bacterium]|nr:hypothetical protein [Caldilineaceae bacterium]
MKSTYNDPIPDEFDSLQAAGDYWDEHSLADHWEETEEVDFSVRLQGSTVLIPIEQKLAERLRMVARRQGLSAETLVNLCWLSM